MTWMEAIYRALLRTFPAAFRAEFEGEINGVAHQKLEEARGRGSVVLIGVWLRELAGLLGIWLYALRWQRRHAPQQHRAWQALFIARGMSVLITVFIGLPTLRVVPFSSGIWGPALWFNIALLIINVALFVGWWRVNVGALTVLIASVLLFTTTLLGFLNNAFLSGSNIDAVYIFIILLGSTLFTTPYAVIGLIYRRVARETRAWQLESTSLV